MSRRRRVRSATDLPVSSSSRRGALTPIEGAYVVAVPDAQAQDSQRKRKWILVDVGAGISDTLERVDENRPE